MRIAHYERNDRGRDFAVGDLHGHRGLLQARLDGVGFDPRRDRLFCVGDLVDRGPESLACLELAFEPWCHSVMGNHEAMMFDALLRRRHFDLWMRNGGEWIYELSIGRVTGLCHRLAPSLPLALEVETACGRVGLVHAEVPGDDWPQVENGDPQILLWARERVERRREDPVRGIAQVICGHTPVREPLRLGNVLDIDTGAYFTGRLTLVGLNELLQQG
ncbi:metallophosphoesterase [Marinobacterium nitratireducens]|nr:metallophosphoesterase [Marinobacterium nitratireducens]